MELINVFEKTKLYWTESSATEPLPFHKIKYDYEYQFHNQNFHFFLQTADDLLTPR